LDDVGPSLGRPGFFFGNAMPIASDLEIWMKPICQSARLSFTAIVLLAGLVELSACANVPYIAGEAQGIKQRDDLQTGSNLLRHEKGNASVRQVDRDALESSLRGINGNRDNGK
jgi:hypothetical protein